jgi:hypothetical protein
MSQENVEIVCRHYEAVSRSLAAGWSHCTAGEL